MNHLDNLTVQAGYNQWINRRVFDAAQKLTADERYADQAAYFGSVAGTLNHLVVGDSIWLRRFFAAPIEANDTIGGPALEWLPKPTALDQLLYPQWDELKAMREQIDQLIIEWIAALDSADLDHVLRYTNTQGRPFARSLGLLLSHFFNHQTHHRGQVSTLLFQNGIDQGITDMLHVIPEVV